MTTVSVIVPAYNRATRIPETVESLLRQGASPAEIIIVDDGSTDATESVCANFSAPVRYIRQENAGVAAARNRGAKEASGEWLAFADSDDTWEVKKLEVQLAVVAAIPSARWCITGCEVIDGSGHRIPGQQGFERVFPVFNDLATTANEFFPQYLDERSVVVGEETHRVFAGDAFELLVHGNVALPSSALVHRSTFEATGGFDEAFRFGEETEFFHRISAMSPVAVVMTPLVHYRYGDDGAMTSAENTIRLIRCALTSNEQAARLRVPLPERTSRAQREGKARLLMRLAYANLSTLDRRGARATIREAWSLGGKKSLRSVGIYAASLVPVWGLRVLHAIKRGIRR